MSPDNCHKSERIMAWISPELKDHLDQVIHQRRRENPRFRMSDLIREAVRIVIDNDSQIMGSRAYQVRTFQRQADRLAADIQTAEQTIALLQNVNLQLLAIVSALSLKQQGREIEPQQLIELAVKAAQGDKARQTLKQLKSAATQDK
ncbi:MAG: hypothetical protein L0154_00730 [Chloroflexi bacterium]|nr:hypothetical protein [Chloroflexota bacterium]